MATGVKAGRTRKPAQSRLTYMNAPVATVAGAPSAATAGAGAFIYLSNGAAGSAMLCFSDGTNWKRADTGATAAAS